MKNGVFGTVVAAIIMIPLTHFAQEEPKNLDLIYQREIILLQDLQKLSLLIVEYSQIQRLIRRCNRQIEDNHLPTYCFKLLELPPKTSFFKEWQPHYKLEAIEALCDGALHHQEQAKLPRLRQVTVTLPSTSACRRKAGRVLERLEYQAQTRF